MITCLAMVGLDKTGSIIEFTGKFCSCLSFLKKIDGCGCCDRRRRRGKNGRYSHSNTISNKFHAVDRILQRQAGKRILSPRLERSGLFAKNILNQQFSNRHYAPPDHDGRRIFITTTFTVNDDDHVNANANDSDYSNQQ